MPRLAPGARGVSGRGQEGGSVKVRRRTQGKREASVWPWACAVGAIHNSAFFDDEEGEKRR